MGFIAAFVCLISMNFTVRRSGTVTAGLLFAVGVLLGVATLALAFNWLGGLQRDVPGYTTALEDHIESTNSACTQLQQLSGEHQNQFAAANARLAGKKATCSVTDAGNTVSNRLAAGRTTTTTTTTPSSDSTRF